MRKKTPASAKIVIVPVVHYQVKGGLGMLKGTGFASREEALIHACAQQVAQADPGAWLAVAKYFPAMLDAMSAAMKD